MSFFLLILKYAFGRFEAKKNCFWDFLTFASAVRCGVWLKERESKSKLRVEIGKFQSSPLQFTPGQAKIPKYTVPRHSTAKRKLERLQFSTSSSFVKIWSACSCKFQAHFWTFWALYLLFFDLQTIGVN